MNSKLKSKIADFMQSDELADEFSEIVDKRQREIKDKKMIARGNENTEEANKDVEEEVEEVATEEEKTEVVVTLDEDLDAEIRARATEIAESLVAPLREQFETLQKEYQDELKSLRTKLEGISAITATVTEIIETETPVGRANKAFKLERPSQKAAIVGNEDEKYDDTAEMRNKRFAAAKKTSK